MRKMRNSLPLWVAVSFVASVIIGCLLQNNANFANRFAPIGTIYVNLIKMIMIPLVFSALVLGVSSISDIRKLGKMGSATIAIFLGTTAVAVVVGLVLSVLFKPGLGVALVNEKYEVAEFPKLIDTIVGIIPSNPFAALTDGNMLQIIFFAIVLGIGIVKAGDKGTALRNIMDSTYEVMSSITKGVMYMTPIGICGLIIPVIASNGIKVLLPLLKVIVVFYLGVFIQAGVVYCVLIRKCTDFSIKDFFRKMNAAQVIAFVTCSSAAALPVSIKQAQDELNLSKEVSSFVLPLGATINMDGNALYQGIVALFIAQAYGVELTIPMMLMVILTGTLASIGAAGVPGAGMIVLSTVLLSVGLPVDGIVLVAGIDRILDMGRTFINVTGDAVTACVVEKIMNRKRSERA